MWQAVVFLVLVNLQFSTGKMIYIEYIGNGKSQFPVLGSCVLKTSIVEF